jgi:hypothetical protein
MAVRGQSRNRGARMLSVIIPCHSTPVTAEMVGQQVWYTVASALSNLELLGLPYEIVIVMNGEYPMAASLTHEHSTVKIIFAGANVDSPQAARRLGVQSSLGEILFFLDAHVVIPPNFFNTILYDMREVGADFMGAAHRFIGQNFYAHRIAWDDYLWGSEILYNPVDGDRPAKVALHPHGAFAIRREAYDAIGGYWDGIKGFGGEEPQLCFKLWMFRKTCWVTPRTYHWHWLAPGSRRGPEIFSDRRFVRNFLALAAAYSDEKQVRASYEAFQRVNWQGRSLYPCLVEEILADPEVARERESVLLNGEYKNLRELRVMFDCESVLN